MRARAFAAALCCLWPSCQWARPSEALLVCRPPQGVPSAEVRPDRFLRLPVGLVSQFLGAVSRLLAGQIVDFHFFFEGEGIVHARPWASKLPTFSCTEQIDVDYKYKYKYKFCSGFLEGAVYRYIHVYMWGMGVCVTCVYIYIHI